jgi:hypothetical protein
MASFPSGGWTFTRPSVNNWPEDLRRATPSNGLDSAVRLVFDLGRRFDDLNRLPVFDNEDWGGPRASSPPVPDEETMPPPPVPSKKQKERKPTLKEKPAVVVVVDLIENDPSVCFVFFAYLDLIVFVVWAVLRSRP